MKNDNLFFFQQVDKKIKSFCLITFFASSSCTDYKYLSKPLPAQFVKRLRNLLRAVGGGKQDYQYNSLALSGVVIHILELNTDTTQAF